jgi:putative transposase
MKDNYRQVSLTRLCRLLGMSRQAYYQHFKIEECDAIKEHLVLQEVIRIRERHQRMGCRKVYSLMKPFFVENEIKMGRDSLFDLLQANGLLIRRRKRRIITTQSLHRFRKYPDKVRGIVPSKPNQIWVSDITYWKMGDMCLYISLVTDAFSRKIVGYHVTDHLESSGPILALKMALQNLKENPEGLIHHSDRGVQYCSLEYIKLLHHNNITISMTENGSPYENALAERVNGILKEEYLNDYSLETLQEARSILAFVVDELYNQERPHMSWGLKTPNQVHFLEEQKGALTRD